MDAKKQLSKLGIDLDTSKFELKLRAIAKHAEELADELEKIDKAACQECGGELEEIEIYADDQGPYIISKCIKCGLSYTLDEVEDN